MIRRAAVALALAAGCGMALAGMPEGFAYLGDIDPTIAQDMRYAGADNFTGAPVAGYKAAECVLARPVAEALARVQAGLKEGGRTLIVYDCYRPARAVAAFNAWAKAGGRARDPRWHPKIARNQLVAQGYIAARSGHSSGGSVDLGLAERTRGGVKPLDMGGAFDLFDRRSHTATPGLTPNQRANRKALVDAMGRAGFANYRREWWHFTFRNEPFKGRAFDFEVAGPK